MKAVNTPLKPAGLFHARRTSVSCTFVPDTIAAVLFVPVPFVPVRLVPVPFVPLMGPPNRRVNNSHG